MLKIKHTLKLKLKLKLKLVFKFNHCSNITWSLNYAIWPNIINFYVFLIFRNCSLAFKLAEDHFGIPQLLDPEDMAACSTPDRLSILTYVSEMYHKLKNLQPRSASSPAFVKVRYLNMYSIIWFSKFIWIFHLTKLRRLSKQIKNPSTCSLYNVQLY